MAIENERNNAQKNIYKNNNVEIIDRKSITLTGVEKVKNINENIFVGKVAGCNLTIQGQNMELTKLDLDSGVVEISGLIIALKYLGGGTQGKSFFKRLFK